MAHRNRWFTELKNCDFPCELLNNQMVTVETTMLTPRDLPHKNRSVPGVSDLLRDP
jgi:hypothetical protein